MRVNVYHKIGALDKCSSRIVTLNERISINGIVDKYFNGKFKTSTICYVDSKVIPQSKWDFVLTRKNRTVYFTSILTDPVSALASLGNFVFGLYGYSAVAAGGVLAGGALYGISQLLDFSIPDTTAPSSVYSFAGKTSKNRLGYPIEVWYGRNKMFPSTGAQDYTQSESNNQYLYTVRCIGHGEFDFTTTGDGVYVSDTEADTFEDFEYEIVGPGEKLTLFPDNVVTSPDVENIELYPPDSEEYAGVSGPFIINDSGTQITQIQIDLFFPGGLITGDGDGRVSESQFEYQEIDDSGIPIGSWVSIPEFYYKKATRTPQRITELIGVTAGRYQVRGARITDEGIGGTADKLYWSAMRGFLPSTIDYGEVTMIAVKVRATNNFSSSQASKINVIGTRKLPVWDGLVWSDPQKTRSVAWAFADMVRNEVYGGKLSDDYLDRDQLISDAAYLETKSWYYDDIFESSLSLFEALKRPCNAGRGIPSIIGNKYNIIFDKEDATPSYLYTSDNMQDIGFELIRPTSQKYDGIEIEYEDNTTWLPETVDCLIDDDLGENLQKVKIYGIKDRDSAYQYGLYRRAIQKYQRLSASGSANLDGRSRSMLEYGFVASEQLTNAYTGLVRSIDSDDITCRLSDPVEFTSGETHIIRFKTTDGDTIGPYTCTETPDPYVVETTTPISTSLLALDLNQDPPVYAFGVLNTEAKAMKITSINPSSGESVELGFSLYDERIYSFDTSTAPPIGSDPVPEITPDLPIIEGKIAVGVNPSNPDFITLNWNPAKGAQYYVIESSVDLLSWVHVATSMVSDYTKIADTEVTYYRVAGVNVGQGPWVDNIIDLIDPEGRTLIDPEVRSLLILETEI